MFGDKGYVYIFNWGVSITLIKTQKEDTSKWEK